jgi:hypothetical protein
MSQNTLWNTISQPQPYNFPIWAVLESHSIYTVELLRESSALNWSKIKAWQPATIPEAPKERWEELANEYFQRKIMSSSETLGSKEWFLEGVKYGREQQYLPNSNTILNTGSFGWSHAGYGAVPSITTANDLDKMLSNISHQLSSKNWHSPSIFNTSGKEASCTQDEFKAKYGQNGQNYKDQTNPYIPWNPKWDNL